MNRNRLVPISLLTALAAAIATAAAAAPPEKRPSKEYTIEQFLATTAISQNGFSSDGSKLLYSSNATGIVNVYTVPTAGGAPKALTSSTTVTTTSVSYFPNYDRLLFTRDKGVN